MEQVLLPYVNLNDRDFVKVSQKAVSDLFDWAVQVNTTLNAKIQTILLGTDNRKSAAEQVTEYIKSVKNDENHPFRRLAELQGQLDGHRRVCYPDP